VFAHFTQKSVLALRHFAIASTECPAGKWKTG